MRALAILPVIGALGALAQAGSLDPTFGTGGFVYTDFPVLADDYLNALGVQPDGKIVALGATYEYPTATIVLVRYNADGTLDATFGIGGKVSVYEAFKFAVAEGLCILPDGRIMLAGYANSQMVVARYLPDGTPDTTFNTSGLLFLNPGLSSSASSLIVRSDGRIVLAGGATEASLYKIAIIRLLPDGQYDDSFDSDGLVTTDIPGSSVDIANDVVLQPDGSIVVCGSIGVGQSNTGLCVLRYLSNGALDPAFSGDGIFTHVTGVVHESLRAVALQPDGRVLAVGTSTNNAAAFTLLRLNADGTLDGSFAGDGIASAAPGIGSNGTDLALQPDGRILVAGGIFAGDDKFAVMRFDQQGVLDPTFDGDGQMTTGEDWDYSACPALTLDAQWNIVLGGTTTHNFSNDMTVVRLLNDVTTGMKEPAAPLRMDLAPNPAMDRTELIIDPPPSGPLHVLLHDAEGRLVRDIPGAQYAVGTRLTLDLAGLAPGLYSVELRTDKRVYCTRLIKR